MNTLKKGIRYLGVKLHVAIATISLLLSPGFAHSEVKLGLIVSLQGGASDQGRNWLDGATLAAEELNQNGVKTKLVIEDDATQPARAVTAFKKLTNIDHVQAIIGGTWDFLGEAIYPLAESEKIYTLTPSNPNEILSESAKRNPYVLSNGLSLAAEGRVLEPFLKSTGKTRAGIISVQIPFAQAHAALFKSLATKLNFTTVGEIEIPVEDQLTAFKIAAQKISRSNPEVIYVIADYFRLDMFMTELQNLKAFPIVITTQHLEGAFELSKGNQDRYQNCFGIHPWYKSEDFDARFISKFKKRPAVFAAEGYDAVKFLAQLSGERSQSLTYEGLKGSYKIVPGQNSVVNDQATIVVFRKGQLNTVSTYSPE